MEASPAFQFYVKDWAQSVASMTLEERGAHITLLSHSWTNGPIEEARIPMILGLTQKRARVVWAEVSRRWTRADDGTWTHGRLERERDKQARYRAMQSEKGKASAGRRRQPDSSRGSTAAQPRYQPDTEPNANSAICNLQSADPPGKDHREGRAPVNAGSGKGPVWAPPKARHVGLIDGHAARRHAGHAWCSPRDGFCITPDFHAELLSKSQRTDSDHRAFYAATMAKFDGKPIAEDVFKFWKLRVGEWIVSEAQKSSSGSRVVPDVEETRRLYLTDDDPKVAAS